MGPRIAFWVGEDEGQEHPVSEASTSDVVVGGTWFSDRPTTEGAGNTPVKIEPAEASRGGCRFDCGVDPPSTCTAHRESPYRRVAWGHERSCRKVRTSQSRSRSHPRCLRESRSSPTTSSSECTLDERVFRDPPP